LCKLDPKVEKTLCLGRKKQRIEEQRSEARRNLASMVGGEGDQGRMLRDLITLGVQGITSSIARPIIDTNNS